MSTAFSQSNQASAVEIKAFVKGDPSPFQSFDFQKNEVYELMDYTFRTPLEKVDVFNDLLQLPYPCQIWILPVREETTDLLKGIPDDEMLEKSASLLTMLSTFKDTIERDRTFVIVDHEPKPSLLEALDKFGFTLMKKNRQDLEDIELS